MYTFASACPEQFGANRKSHRANANCVRAEILSIEVRFQQEAPDQEAARGVAFIVAFWGEHMRCPSVREIVAAIGGGNPNRAVGFLMHLHAKGKIVWDSRIVGKKDKAVTRGIVVPELQKAASEAAERYLASIEAGTVERAASAVSRSSRRK